MTQLLVFLQNFLDIAGLSASLLIVFAINFRVFIELISSNESISFDVLYRYLRLLMCLLKF